MGNAIEKIRVTRHKRAKKTAMPVSVGYYGIFPLECCN